MARRWTIAELAAVDDRAFIRALLMERRDGLTNPYSPLAHRIDETLSRLADSGNVLAALELAAVRICRSDNGYCAECKAHLPAHLGNCIVPVIRRAIDKG